MTKISILIADDHELVRRGIRSLLEEEDGWVVTAEAENGRQAVEMALAGKPDVIVLDLGMPDLNGLEATRQILQKQPDARVLVLTVYEAEHVVQEVLEAGAKGYLLKSDAGRELTQAIKALLAGKPYFTTKVARMVLGGYLERKSSPRGSRPPLTALTAREREIAQLLAEGLSTKEIAARLGLSAATATTHRTNIMQKLNLHSVAELVLYCVRNGIVMTGESGIGKT